MDQEEYVEEEQEQCERIQSHLDELNMKWFKTQRTKDLIEFLREYLKIKEKFIEELNRKLYK